jgi:maltooligosyltrehalose trehalohydrolase
VRDALSNSYLLFFQDLLQLRREHVIPQLAYLPAGSATLVRFAETGVDLAWRFASGGQWRLIANVGHDWIESAPNPWAGELIFETHKGLREDLGRGSMPPWSAAWFLAPAEAA